MYRQSALVTSVRGRGFDPTTCASSALGVIGFMNAAFGLRPDFLAALRAGAAFLALFFAAFFALFFALFLAIWSPLEW
jgi:hypothetical protein